MKSTTDSLKLQPASDALRHDPENTSSKGFTIIEVLIVLAIAGLIMLIVFEAIPSLTRALRNGRRKQDISVILDAISSYELKDSDNFPLNCGGASPQPGCNAAYVPVSPPNNYPNDYFMQYAKSQLSYYSYATVTDPIVLTAEGQGNGGQLPITKTNAAPTEQVDVYDYEKCDADGDGGATDTGADYNDIVALYALEEGSGTARAQCQEL
jgi:prepilin-type N-terminal cleavage/methylation domain-containing protein